MSSKVGRNDPCWCGSGRKFKHCHSSGKTGDLASVEQLISTFTSSFDKKNCMHPDASPTSCKGGIIKAHTIQKSGGLSRIARDAHVYQFDANYTTLRKTKGELTVKPVGLNNASTFTGFCAHHDNMLFAPLEKVAFKASEEQIFLLAYRALYRELFYKKGQVELSKKADIFAKGKDPSLQAQIYQFWADIRRGGESSLRKLNHYKALYDKALLDSSFSRMSYYVVEFNSVPDFLCSACLYPEFDFDGVELQDLSDLTSLLDHLAFTLIATSSGGAAVFSWYGYSRAGYRLVQSVNRITDQLLPSAIQRLVFEHFENVYMSPEWWDKLSGETQESLTRRQMSSSHPLLERESSCLRDDGVRLFWDIVKRRTNLSF